MASQQQRLRPPQLPQQPRKREAFAGSARLAGAGKNISRTDTNRSEQKSQSPPSARSVVDELAAAQGGSDGVLNSGRANSVGSDISALVGAGQSNSPPRRDASGQQNSPTRRDAVPPLQINAPTNVSATDMSADATELARGGEALLKRLHDVGSANNELRRQLEAQTREMAMLEESCRVQQQLLKDFERHARGDGVGGNAPPFPGAAGSSAEAQLRAELEEVKLQAQRDKEQLTAQLRQCEKERGQREGERDEARVHVQELDARVQNALEAPERNQARLNALDMEVTLLRSRFAKEAAAREAAEKASADAKNKQVQMQSELDRSKGETRQLHRALAEQAELVTFRQEICNDLQSRLQNQTAEAEKRLVRERGKFEAVQRLEGVLPKHMLLKALAC